MYFKPLLEFLQMTFQCSSFSTNDVHRVMYDPRVVESDTEVGQYLKSKLPIRMKMVSKDCDRLFKMGLLNRKKLRRQVKTRTGKSCFKGFAYSYSISAQGHSYVLEYLWKPQPRRSRIELRDRMDFYALEYIKKHASSAEAAEALWAIHRGLYPRSDPKSIELRFPLKNDTFILEMFRRVTKERDQLRQALPEIRRQLSELNNRQL